MTGRAWRRASVCIDGKCLEVTTENVRIDDTDRPMILVRNSNDGVFGTILAFTRQEWADFIAGVKAGEFDLP